MVAVRERIRINGRPISEEDFAKFFFEVWDILEATPEVDATILEVGVGGTYDSTNIVPKPVVTGITSLGFDHQGVLGKTLPEIAWQKGGIYKEGVPALTVNQPEDAMEVLRQRAEELKASEFKLVPAVGLSDIKLGLAGVHQVSNACLAVAMAQTFLERQTHIKLEPTLSRAFIEGLEQVRWPGRCQTIQDPKGRTTWFLDGAHTVESLDCCIRWFVSPGVGLPLDTSQRPTRVLLFNITHGRSGQAFLGAMEATKLAQLKLHGRDEDQEMFFSHVIFCTNTTYASGSSKSDLVAVSTTDEERLTTQQELASAWSTLKPTFPVSHMHVVPTIEHAVKTIDAIGQQAGSAGVYALVTGSLHLVGGLIEAASLSDVAL
ncbi:hypothetical protein HWV62_18308 [Athelia sp. TMB]|nr:hypothetical protein HWV62_18308 [Athelia sp. TMB]